MFSTKELFTKALQIEQPWFIERVEFDFEKGKLDVWIDLARGFLFHFEIVGLGIRGQINASVTISYSPFFRQENKVDIYSSLKAKK